MGNSTSDVDSRFKSDTNIKCTMRMSFTNLTKLNEVNATDSEIFTQFSRVFTFSTNESGFKLTKDLIQLRVNSLKTT